MIDWLRLHPVAAGGAIFLIALGDSLVVVGIAIPATPFMFAAGALIGLGYLDGSYALACATLGAMLGDGLGLLAGRRWGLQVRSMGPFRRYPSLFERGERLFRRNDIRSIFIARFVGPIRPFVPAIAGMLHMPMRRYLPANALAAVAWSAALLGPGWLLGASLETLAAVADRLAIVLAGVFAVIASMWFIILSLWRWFDGHADALLAGALRWSRDHARLGPIVRNLVDPNRPESPSLVILALAMLVFGWGWFALLTRLLMGGGLQVDLRVHQFMLGLRNPLADQLMAAFSILGDAAVLVPSTALAMLWLMWRRRWKAAAHWIAALAFGLVLTMGLAWLVHMPAPPSAHGGFGFPSATVTMATISFGFFAVLIARELPGRSRVWPYLLAAAVVTLLGLSRVYLGVHWLSDVVGGALLGCVWLLVLGLAYRRHVARSFWMGPLAWIFYGSFLAAVFWHAQQQVGTVLAEVEPPAPALVLQTDQWWQARWQDLPDRRVLLTDSRSLALDVQFAGSLELLHDQLHRRGWRSQPQAGWIEAIGLLNGKQDGDTIPVLPATLGGRAEALLMRKQSAEGKLLALRVWHAPARLADNAPLWIGSVELLEVVRPFELMAFWQLAGSEESRLPQLVADLGEMETSFKPQSTERAAVLLVRSR